MAVVALVVGVGGVVHQPLRLAAAVGVAVAARAAAERGGVGELVPSGGVVPLAHDERLRKEHPRHADEREGEEEELNRRLAPEEVRLGEDDAGAHEHLDEHRDQRRRHLAVGDPVDAPLVEDAEDEVAEDREQEDELRRMGVDER